MAARVVTRLFRPVLLSQTSKHFIKPTLLSNSRSWQSIVVPRIHITTLARGFASPPQQQQQHQQNQQHQQAVADAQTIVERDHFVRVKAKLESDTRRKISYAEYENICTKEGLTKGQAKQLAQSLSDSGIILYFGNSSNAVLRDFVFLKPVEFNKTVSRILAQLSDDTYLRDQLALKQSELAKLKAELKPLEEQRENLEVKAHRSANTVLWLGFGYCVAQAVLVARLTWWELSWDVMEPVTYMLTFATVLIGYSYFVVTGSEYTFEGLRRTLERRKLAKLIKRKGFDEVAYKRLQDAVLLREDEIQRVLEDLESDPVTLHLKNPNNPIV